VTEINLTADDAQGLRGTIAVKLYNADLPDLVNGLNCDDVRFLLKGNDGMEIEHGRIRTAGGAIRAGHNGPGKERQVDDEEQVGRTDATAGLRQ